MHRYLVVLLWPVGLAAIAGIAYLLVQRSPETHPARAAGAGAAPSRRSHKAAGNGPALTDVGWESARFGAAAVAGTLIVFGLMCALGLLVVYHGLTIDRPIFTFMHHHQVHLMAALMKRLTKIGDTWTCWGAAAAASACLAVTWRSKKWFPPVVLATTIVGDHFTTLALRHVFHRIGPPTSPLGTYPSGGCDRVILFYGLIGYLLWREFSGERRTAIWLGAGVAALGFNEAYSRVYLSLHWFTDSISGLLYGTLLLAVFIASVQLVAGRPVRPGRPGRSGAHADLPAVAARFGPGLDVSVPTGPPR